MDLGLIRQLYDEGLVSFQESVASWEEAIMASIRPLVDKGLVDREYGLDIIKNAETNGMYIFLAPHICMPHCGSYNYVHSPCMCFMKVNQAVTAEYEGENLKAELFFAIAAKEEGQHLDYIKNLSVMLMDEEIVEALLSVKNEEDLKTLFQNNNK